VDGESLQAAAFSAGPGEQEAMAAELARLAARIHAVPLDALPERLPRPPDWDTYIDERIEAYREIEAGWIERDPVLRYVAAWLDAQPP
jgi:aminoglycoside phosphotransferase (APT) family kinase protein